MASGRGRLRYARSARGNRARSRDQQRTLEALVDELCLAMPIAKANTRQKSPRIIGPEARDVTRITRHSTQHEHLRGKRAGREQQRPCYSNPHEASTEFLSSRFGRAHCVTPVRSGVKEFPPIPPRKALRGGHLRQ